VNTDNTDKEKNDNLPKEFAIPEQIESDLSEIKRIIEGLPEPQQKQIIKSFIEISVKSYFSGPIPPPDLLRGYNSIIPNGAERIFLMAENQSAHRIHMEEYVVKEEIKQSAKGQIFGFVIGIFGLTLASVLAMYGHEWIAGVFGTTTIIGLVTVFVLGKKSQQKK